MKTTERGELLYNSGGVFKISEGINTETYLCRGSKKDVYEVIYHKDKDVFTCTCKNIKKIPCYHKEATKICREKASITSQ